jgi:hypothetical protein
LLGQFQGRLKGIPVKISKLLISKLLWRFGKPYLRFKFMSKSFSGMAPAPGCKKQLICGIKFNMYFFTYYVFEFYDLSL